MKGEAGYTSSQSYQLQVFVDLVRHFVGPHWVPDEFGIEHPTVPATAKEDFPTARILGNQRVGYIAIPRACLHMATRSSEGEDSGEAPLVLTGRFDYAETVRALLRPHLSEGYPSARLAASLMDTSVRTLARRLSACGVTYRALVDELRFTTARDLLCNQSLRIIVAGLSPRQFRHATKFDSGG